MNTKEQILYAALNLFLKQGYKAISINNIVATVGVSKGSFYHYFRSKEELLEQIFDIWLDKDIRDLKDDLVSSTDSTRRKIKKVFSHVSAGGSKHLEFSGIDNFNKENYALLILEGMTQYPSFKEKVKNAYLGLIEVYEELLQSGVKRGELRSDLDCKLIALVIASLREGLYILHLFNPEVDLKSDRERMFDILWERIKAEDEYPVRDQSEH